MANRSDVHNVEEQRRPGKSRLRWEDCIKRHLERVGGELRTAARKNWRLLIQTVVRKMRKVKGKTNLTTNLVTGLPRVEQQKHCFNQ